MTAKESTRDRRKMLEALAKASRKGKEPWVRLESIGVVYPNVIATRLVKLGLIKTRLQTTGLGLIESKGELWAKITQAGLHALENNRFTYRELQKGIQLPMHVYTVLEGMARRLEIMMPTGKDVGKKPSVVALLAAMTAKEEQLERWFRSNYAKEYGGQ